MDRQAKENALNYMKGASQASSFWIGVIAVLLNPGQALIWYLGIFAIIQVIELIARMILAFCMGVIAGGMKH